MLLAWISTYANRIRAERNLAGVLRILIKWGSDYEEIEDPNAEKAQRTLQEWSRKLADSMKPENETLIKSLLEHSESLQEDIFAGSEQMLGSIPFILRVMVRRPEFMIFSSLKDFCALRPKNLDDKTAELLAVAAAAGAGADRCLKLHMTSG